jgi:hypothetical protein
MIAKVQDIESNCDASSSKTCRNDFFVLLVQANIGAHPASCPVCAKGLFAERR